MLAPQRKPVRIAEVPVEHRRQRVAVGHVEIAHRRDRDVELDRIDVAAKQARRHTAPQDAFDACDQGQSEIGDLARLAHVAPALKVLGVDQGDVVLVLPEEREGEIDQL
ncbi:hypothetical protein chiPu_0029159, partial [Chiloscyllium punctatum]|nr:hypothetical protein [Chiloscyllium punctatum]